MSTSAERQLRVITALAATATLANGFAFVPATRCSTSNLRPGASWAGDTCARSRIAPKMVLAEPTDVAEREVGSLGPAELKERAPGGMPVESRFDKLKTNYKGVQSVLDIEDNDVYQEFDSMLSDHKVSFTRGEIVKGTVVQFEPGGALVDIGAKATAYMPAREVSLDDVEDIEGLIEIDDEREVMIITDENDMGQVQVSIRRIQFEKAWATVQEMQQTDSVFEGPIIGVNRGGAIVLVEGLRGFLPGSHLCGGLPTEDAVGQMLQLKFLEVNAETNKLVVSNRRAVLEQEMKELSRGDVVEGHVKAIKPYGAFVEIRGMSGLLHISQISFDRIEDLPSILSMGMPLKCMIIDHDKVNGRIALSTKTLEPEPGDMIKNPQKVYDMAEMTAAKYHERMEHERKAREDAAKSIVMGLGDGLDSFDSDVLASIADGIETVLKAPVSSDPQD